MSSPSPNSVETIANSPGSARDASSLCIFAAIWSPIVFTSFLYLNFRRSPVSFIQGSSYIFRPASHFYHYSCWKKNRSLELSHSFPCLEVHLRRGDAGGVCPSRGALPIVHLHISALDQDLPVSVSQKVHVETVTPETPSCRHWLGALPLPCYPQQVHCPICSSNMELKPRDALPVVRPEGSSQQVWPGLPQEALVSFLIKATFIMSL